MYLKLKESQNEATKYQLENEILKTEVNQQKLETIQSLEKVQTMKAQVKKLKKSKFISLNMQVKQNYAIKKAK